MKMTPIININGTTRESLVEARRNVLTAIDALMEAMNETAPHGRDYVGEPERYTFDRSIYAARFATLDKLRNEIQDEALAIHNGDQPAEIETRYQLVGTSDDHDMLTLAGLEIRQTITGEQSGSHLRPELRGQPILANMCGPMWGGWRNAAGESLFLEDDSDPTSEIKSYCKAQGPVAYAVCRYETWEMYERMSR